MQPEMDKAVPVAVLKVLSEHTSDRYDAARTEAAASMAQGDRRIVRSPLDNAKLGAVYMTDPSPKTVITDRTSLTEWFDQHYPESVEDRYEVVPDAEREVVDVLFAHAPHLLRKVHAISGAALSSLRKESAALGQIIGPGGEVDVPGIEIETAAGTVGCRPDPGALDAVRRLFESGRLTLDGTLRPELESGDGH